MLVVCQLACSQLQEHMLLDTMHKQTQYGVEEFTASHVPVWLPGPR